jgi:hypothetical protein
MDKEIIELRGLVERSAKDTTKDCGGKLNKALQHIIWRPGKNPATTGERQQEQQNNGRGSNG